MAELNDGTAADLRSARATVSQVLGDDGEVVLHIAGEVDISSISALREAINRAIELAPRRLVLELSGLTFMDSSGIAVILTAAEQIGAVELHNPTEIIRRLITLSGLADVLRMTP
ncbi:MAG TPA: STAS domain-containing protein [Jatrophihabitantaceae bacterium]|nr:STAS domain-containing protein [Jatrophihabitantaceae bacterium]